SDPSRPSSQWTPRQQQQQQQQQQWTDLTCNTTGAHRNSRMVGSGCLLALLLLATLGLNHLAAGGCAGRCCRSRDWACLSTDWSMQRVFGTCYCDDGCARTQDCCFDYFTECPGLRSEPWSHWSGCAEPCRPAARVRVRRVEQQPGHGGQPCPGLEQRAGCLEYRDHAGKRCGPHMGPAFITSNEFAKGRPTHDSYGVPLNPGFCVEFSLQSRAAHCAVETRPHTHWMRYITEGFSVDAVLHWVALGSPRCGGTWRKVRQTPRCHCPPQHSFVFI
ncbi:hypothetical protein CRUP_000737, partial [Coryphaenoides rupestris]